MSKRADAVNNHDRIVTAARAALAESNGAIDNLKLHLVAKAAGIGQGTLYRHFPTRDHLLAEVYRQEISALVTSVPELLASSTPLAALTLWLDQLLDYARVKRGVIAAIEASAWQDLYADQHDRLDNALNTLLDQGKKNGTMRSDIDATDVILLLGALSRIPTPEWDSRAPNLVAVILDGVQTR